MLTTLRRTSRKSTSLLWKAISHRPPARHSRPVTLLEAFEPRQLLSLTGPMANVSLEHLNGPGNLDYNVTNHFQFEKVFSYRQGTGFWNNNQVVAGAYDSDITGAYAQGKKVHLGFGWYVQYNGSDYGGYFVAVFARP